MKKILVSLICCLTATLGWAQEKNAYTLFDAQGNRVDYTQMMDVLERQDVVFIGSGEETDWQIRTRRERLRVCLRRKLYEYVEKSDERCTFEWSRKNEN